MSVSGKLELVVATTNPGKLWELRELLGNAAIELRSLADFVPAPAVVEDGETYLDNARKKAHAAAKWTGRPALGDDSGLEVDALGGAPGVHSARFASDAQDSKANIDKLLYELRTVAPPQRGARFRCVIVVAAPDGREMFVEGVCAGSIAGTPRGAKGFGYDPVFVFDGDAAARTFAEMSAAEKQGVSHRAQACAALGASLEAFLRDIHDTAA